MARPDPHREEETEVRLQMPSKHPRDLQDDDRREAMSALARKRWEKRDRMRATANDNASHDANIDASGAEGGATESGMAASSTGSSATAAVDLAVIKALERKAQAGDVAAAKELREWRSRDQTADADADALRLAIIIGKLTVAERRWLHEMVTKAQELPANEVIRKGTKDGFDAPPIGDAPTAGNDEPFRAAGTARLI